MFSNKQDQLVSQWFCGVLLVSSPLLALFATPKLVLWYQNLVENIRCYVRKGRFWKYQVCWNTRSSLTLQNLTRDERICQDLKINFSKSILQGIFLWKRVIIHLRVDLYDNLETIIIRNSDIDILKICFEFNFRNKRIRNGSNSIENISLTVEP